MKTKERNSNIELLRIFATVGVIILHYNYPTIGGALTHTIKGSPNYCVLMLLECIFISSVDLFILITGYYSAKQTKTNAKKLFGLFIEVSVIRFTFSGLSAIRNGTWSASDIIYGLLPYDYFIVFYVVIMILAPYINKLLDQMDAQSNANFLLLLLFLFSVLPSFMEFITATTGFDLKGISTVSRQGSIGGGTIINFVLLYITGGVLKRTENKYSWMKNRGLIIGFWVGCIIMLIVQAYIENVDVSSSLGVTFQYCNPFIIGTAVFSFLIFSNFKSRCNRAINNIAKASFTVYLTHGYFFKLLRIENYTNKGILVLIVHVIVSCIMLYAIGLLIYWTCAFLIRHIRVGLKIV